MERALIPAVKDNYLSRIDPLLSVNTIAKRTGKEEWSLRHRPVLSQDIDYTGNVAGCVYTTDYYGTDQLAVTYTASNYYYTYSTTTQTIADTNINTDTLPVIKEVSSTAPSAIVIQFSGGNLLSSSDVGAVYLATDRTSAASKITDVDMPGNDGTQLCRGVAFLDGFTFVANLSGKIYNSTVDDPTAWAALDFLTAENVDDKALYLGNHLNHVVLISNKSIEFFYNAANATGSPLSVRQDMFHQFRPKNTNAITEVGDTIFMVGSKPNERQGLWVLDGFKLNKLSNSIVDEWIEDQTQAIPSKISIPGYADHLVIEGDSATLALNLEVGTWHYWTTNGGGLGIYGATNGGYVVTNNGGLLASWQDTTFSTTTELGNSLDDCYFITHPWDGNTTNRKRLKYLMLLHYPTADSDESPNNVGVSWRDTNLLDSSGIDVSTFTTVRNMDASTMDSRLYRLGITRQRIFKIDLNTTTIAKGLEVAFDYLRG